MTSREIRDLQKRVKDLEDRLRTGVQGLWTFVVPPKNWVAGLSAQGFQPYGLQTTYGLPAGIKAVLLDATCIDSGSSADIDCGINFSPITTAQAIFVSCAGLLDNARGANFILVPCDSQGEIYYQANPSSGSSLIVNVDIWGYLQ